MLERIGPCLGFRGPGVVLILIVLVAELGERPSLRDHFPAGIDVADPAVDEGALVAVATISFAADLALVDQPDQCADSFGAAGLPLTIPGPVLLGGREPDPAEEPKTDADSDASRPPIPI